MRRLAVIAVLAVAVAGGCDDRPEPADGRKPLVVVSVLPQADFVERIAGGVADVRVMIPPGANPATFEPTVGQMQDFARAALYVKVGHPDFPFERAWLDGLLSGRDDLPVVDCSEGLVLLDEDPHVWVSPAVVRSAAVGIHDALNALLPDSRATLDENLKAFLAEIDVLDTEIAGMLAPHRGKRFVVFHPAWGYLAADYGLVQVAIEHEGKEPNPGDLLRLLRSAEADGTRVVFVQPQFPRQTAEVLAREIGAEVRVADPLARDWAANLREVARALRDSWE